MAVQSSVNFSQAFMIFMGFFAVMNPIANVPVFLGLTQGLERKQVIAVATKAVFLAFLIVAVFALGGKFIFDLFGITLPAFKIAGGLIVLTIGFKMLHGTHSSVHHPSEEDKAEAMDASLDIAVSPLATPLLAGPGTITTAISFSAGGPTSLLITLLSLACLCVITYGLFLFGEKMVEYLGKSALGVITRMMGLILAVMGVQMIIAGIQGSFWH